MVYPPANPPERADTPANIQHLGRSGPLAPHLEQVLRLRPHEEIHLRKNWLINSNSMRQWGFYGSVGMKPAIRHWRHELPDGQEIHLVEQDAHLEIHWDRVSLRRNPIGHLIADAPGLAILAVVVWLALSSRAVPNAVPVGGFV